MPPLQMRGPENPPPNRLPIRLLPIAYASSCSFALLLFRPRQIVILPQPALTFRDHSLRRLLGRLAENVENDDGVRINAVDDPPRLVLIVDAQFVTPFADGRHRAGVRQRKVFASLQPAQKHSGFNSRFRRKRRRFDLAAQPDQGLVIHRFALLLYVSSDIVARPLPTEDRRRRHFKLSRTILPGLFFLASLIRSFKNSSNFFTAPARSLLDSPICIGP